MAAPNEAAMDMIEHALTSARDHAEKENAGNMLERKEKI